MATTPFAGMRSPLIPSEGPTVAVVGCGPAGMFFLRQLEFERSKLEEQFLNLIGDGESDSNGYNEDNDKTQLEDRLRGLPRPTVFEKDSKCGGLWQSKAMAPDQRENENEGMYDGMWINAPKEIFEFADYTFDRHFGKPMPSYITRHQVLGYIEGATKDAIDYHTNAENIVFREEVKGIDFNDTTKLFAIDTWDFEYGEWTDTRFFDKVILATGNEYEPSIPDRELQMLKGSDDETAKGATTPIFDRPAIHSSQIKSLGADIAEKDFLFIGSSYSAEDLALSFIKRGANHIYITTRGLNGYPVGDTASWPMDKVTVLYQSEIKEVLEGNKIRTGRRKFTSKNVQHVAETHYNQTHNDFVLEGIDAVIFCTGYDENYEIMENHLSGYSETNPALKTNHDDSYWPNVYDPAVFDPENGRVMPSETEFNSCGQPVHENNGTLYAIPDSDQFGFFERPGHHNHHLITNPGYFIMGTLYETPLLNLDIQAAYVVKVMTGDIPTPDTEEEMHMQRARNIAEWIRHSSDVRYYADPVFQDAWWLKSWTDISHESMRPYTAGFTFFKMFSEARRAGHPAGTFIVEYTDVDDSELPTDVDCWDYELMRFRNVDGPYGLSGNTTWGFSERGVIFMQQAALYIESHHLIEKGTNQTFRDLHYPEYQSVYTGTKPRPFSKPWMDIDDILGDVLPEAEANTSTTTVGGDDCGAAANKGCASSDAESRAEL